MKIKVVTTHGRFRERQWKLLSRSIIYGWNFLLLLFSTLAWLFNYSEIILHTIVACKTLLKMANEVIALYWTVFQFDLFVTQSLKLFNSLIVLITLNNSQNLCTISKHQWKAVEDGKSNLFDCAINSDLQRILLRFLKFILGLNRGCTSEAILGETEKHLVLIQAFMANIKFQCRSTRMDRSTFLKQAIEFKMNNSDSMEWAAAVIFLLPIFNFQHLLDNLGRISSSTFAKRCKQKLCQRFVKSWKSAECRMLNVISVWNHI